MLRPSVLLPVAVAVALLAWVPRARAAPIGGSGPSASARRPAEPSSSLEYSWPFGLRPSAGRAVLAVEGSGPSASARRPAEPSSSEGPGFVRLLRDLGLPREAAREVERLRALDDARGLPDTDLFELGVDLARQGDLARAARLLELAIDRTANPAVADERRLSLGMVHLKAGSYPLAERFFSKVGAFGETPPVRARADRLACLGHLEALDVVPARACVAALIGQPLPPEIQRALARVEAEERWRGYVGGSLSAIVPGLGQATAGEPLDGSIALLVNGGWGASLVALVGISDYVDAALLLVGFASRYYIGNIQHGAADWSSSVERERRQAAETLMRSLAALPPR